MNRDKVLELAREAELARQIALEVPFVVDRLERFAALIEREVRGDAEPTLYQRRMKPLFDYKFPWSDWKECSKEVFDQFEKQQVWGDYVYEVRKLYLHPAPAASAESVASVHIKDGCLIGSQRKSGVDIPDGQYALYPIGTCHNHDVDVEQDRIDAECFRFWVREAASNPVGMAQLISKCITEQEYRDAIIPCVEKAKAAIAAAKDAGL